MTKILTLFLLFLVLPLPFRSEAYFSAQAQFNFDNVDYSSIDPNYCNVQENLDKIACPYPSEFSFDCQNYRKFKCLSKEFIKINIPIDEIPLYRSIRLMDQSLVSSGTRKVCQGTSEIQRPWLVYSPAPDVWTSWEKGNREILKKSQEKKKEVLKNKTQNNGAVTFISMNDLSELHKLIMDEKKANIVDRFLYKIGFNIPGKFKTIRNYNILKNSDPFIENKMNDPLTCLTKNGKALMTSKRVDKKNVIFQYTKNELLYEAFQELLDQINTYMNSFNIEYDSEGIEKFTRKQNELYKSFPYMLSPSEFALFIQKKYVSIHPFPDGQGRMSRYLQDFITNYFNLPPFRNGDFMNDLEFALTQRVGQGRSSFKMLAEDLTTCLSEFKDYENTKKISSLCNPLYTPLKYDCDELKVDKTKAYNNYFLGEPEKNNTSTCVQKKTGKISFFINKIGSVFHKQNNSQQIKHEKMEHHQDPSLFIVSGNEIEKKRKILESFAEPIGEDMQSYRWTPGKFGIVNNFLMNHSRLYRKYVGVGGDNFKKRNNSQIFMGKGLYVSLDPFDSAHYAIWDSKKQSPYDSKKIRLSVVTLRKGEKLLDVSNPDTLENIRKAYKSNGIKKNTDENINNDLASLRLNMAIKYSNTWVNLKNLNTNGYKISSSETLKSDLEMNQLFSLMYVANYQVDYNYSPKFSKLRQYLVDTTAKHKEYWMKNKASHLKAHQDIPEDPYHWTPFGECIKLVNGNVTVVDNYDCENSKSLENKLIITKKSIKGESYYFIKSGNYTIQVFRASSYLPSKYKEDYKEELEYINKINDQRTKLFGELIKKTNAKSSK